MARPPRMVKKKRKRVKAGRAEVRTVRNPNCVQVCGVLGALSV